MLRDPSLSGERSDFLFRNVGLSNRRWNHGSLLDAFGKCSLFVGQKVGALRLASSTVFVFFPAGTPELAFFGVRSVCVFFVLFYLS